MDPTDISTNEQPQTVEDPDLDETITLPGLDDTIMVEDSGQAEAGSTKNPGEEEGYDSNDTIELIITGDPIIPTPSPGPGPTGNVSNLQSTDSAPSDTPTEQPEATPRVIPIVPDIGVPTVPEDTPETPIVTPTGPPITPTGPPSPAAVNTPIITPTRRGKRPGRAGRPSSRHRAFAKAATTILSYKRRSYRRDGVDEECERLKIKYKKWEGTDDPKDYAHASHLPFGTQPLVSKEQNQNDYCVLCPRKRALDEDWDVKRHYTAVHEMGHLVVNDTVLLVCKCSEVRSRGWATDKSTRNRHFHCIVCHHPRDNPNQIGNHMYKRHQEISRSEVSHLLKEKTPAFEQPE